MNELLIDDFSELRESFKTNQHLSLKEYIDKKYLPTLLQFILCEFGPNKTEILQIAQKINTPELKRFQCGIIWLEVKKGEIKKI